MFYDQGAGERSDNTAEAVPCNDQSTLSVR